MARGCRPFAPVVRLCALLLLAPLDTWAATGEVKDAFLKIHNIYRCMHGVPEAEWDDKIAEGAQNFAAGSAYDAKSKQILSDPVVASEQKGSNAYLMNAGEAEEKHAREASAVFYYSIKLYDGNKWSPAVADAAKRASGNLGGQYDFMAFLGAMLWKPKQEIAYKIGCGTGVHDNNTVIVCRYQSPPPCIPNGRGKWQECFPTSHILVKEYEECAEEIGYDNTLQPKVPKSIRENGLSAGGNGGDDDGTPTWVWIVLAVCIILFVVCCCAICIGLAYWYKKKKQKEQEYGNNYNNPRRSAPQQQSRAPDDWEQSHPPSPRGKKHARKKR
eukprot:GEMP01035950.1.p1 GENE.GEMP01035950.1~~GEMP01035950.1.p1  ORF type:complete len:329 (+),score=80.02 GEMP01035950.1:346-1332(+)